MSKLFVVVILLFLGTLSSGMTIAASGTESTGFIMNALGEVYTATENPDVIIDYQISNSETGKDDLISGNTIFGGSETDFSDEQYEQIPDLQMLPLIAVGFVPYTASYSSLVFSGELLAEIFMGIVTQWDDEKITSLNSDTTFSSVPITIVYNQESSGTTTVFTRALSAMSPLWNETYGDFDTWPTELTSLDNFIPAVGEEGIFTFTSLTPNSISYVSYSLIVRSSSEQFAVSLLNQEDRIVSCNTESIELATIGSVFSARFTSDLSNPSDLGAWPISSYSYLLLRTSSTPVDMCDELTETLRYIMYSVTHFTTLILLEGNAYASISSEGGIRFIGTLATITCNGEPSLDISDFLLSDETLKENFYYTEEYSSFSSIYTIPLRRSYSTFFNSIGSTIEESEADTLELSSLSHLEESTYYFYQRFYGNVNLSDSGTATLSLSYGILLLLLLI